MVGVPDLGMFMPDRTAIRLAADREDQLRIGTGMRSPASSLSAEKKHEDLPAGSLAVGLAATLNCYPLPSCFKLTKSSVASIGIAFFAAPSRM